ncbi:hypothetical protein FKM82_011312 [Ascaphus truei]
MKMLCIFVVLYLQISEELAVDQVNQNKAQKTNVGFKQTSDKTEPQKGIFRQEQCGNDFGKCIEGQTSCKVCEGPFRGTITAKCQNSQWNPITENCVSHTLLSSVEVTQ